MINSNNAMIAWRLRPTALIRTVRLLSTDTLRVETAAAKAAADSLAPTLHVGVPSARQGLPPPAQPNLAARRPSRPQRLRRAPGPIPRSAPSATRMPTSSYRRSSCCFGSGRYCWSYQCWCALPVPAQECPYSPYIVSGILLLGIWRPVRKMPASRKMGTSMCKEQQGARCRALTSREKGLHSRL